jgi:bifunctional non-homologous end joining protein LigD
VLPKEALNAPEGEDWIYEFLWSGERVRAIKVDAGVWVLGRDGRNLSNRFPRVAAAVAKLRPPSVVIDGEILLLGGYSPAAVRYLSRNCDEAMQSQVVLLAYDLLHRGAEDMRGLPLLGRRLVLASLVQQTPLVLSPLFHGSSGAALNEASRLGLAGVVAKRAGSCYQPSALAHSWVKVLVPPLRPPGPLPRNEPARGVMGIKAFAGAAAVATMRS